RRAMRKLTWIMLVPAAALVAACGRSRAPAVDDALKSDLALAAQAQIGNPSAISATEAGYAPQQYASSRATPTVARRTTTSSPRPPRSGAPGSSGGGGGYYPAPAPQTTPVKHTGRDAAIGAAAGAVIGATTSRDKIKGGLIGAAAGGILGAVIG